MSLAFANELERKLYDLGVQAFDDAVIFGSAVMKVHGIKDEIGDVDLFVTPRAYARLRQTSHWTEQRPNVNDPPLLEAAHGYVFHAFHSWPARDAWLDVPDAVATAERFCGILCVRLELVAKWKVEALAVCVANGIQVTGSRWEKHAHDLQLLYDHGLKP